MAVKRAQRKKSMMRAFDQNVQLVLVRYEGDVSFGSAQVPRRNIVAFVSPTVRFWQQVSSHNGFGLCEALFGEVSSRPGFSRDETSVFGAYDVPIECRFIGKASKSNAKLNPITTQQRLVVSCWHMRRSRAFETKAGQL